MIGLHGNLCGAQREGGALPPKGRERRLRKGDRVWQVRTYYLTYLLTYLRGAGSRPRTQTTAWPPSLYGTFLLWQIAFGSGFKCNSAVWVALRNQ